MTQVSNWKRSDNYFKVKKIQKSLKNYVIKVVLTTNQLEYEPNEPIMLNIQLVNESPSDLHIYKPNTIFEGTYLLF